MSAMACHATYLELPGGSGTDIHDVTPQAHAAVRQSGVRTGLLTVHAPGSTAAVTTIEHEPGVLEDLGLLPASKAVHGFACQSAGQKRGFARPPGRCRARRAIHGPRGESRSRHAGCYRPLLGTWQQIVVLDLDNRPRQRRVLIQVLGG